MRCPSNSTSPRGSIEISECQCLQGFEVIAVPPRACSRFVLKRFACERFVRKCSCETRSTWHVNASTRKDRRELGACREGEVHDLVRHSRCIAGSRYLSCMIASSRSLHFKLAGSHSLSSMTALQSAQSGFMRAMVRNIRSRCHGKHYCMISKHQLCSFMASVIYKCARKVHPGPIHALIRSRLAYLKATILMPFVLVFICTVIRTKSHFSHFY